MPYELYKEYLKLQKAYLKKRSRGKLHWLSKLHPTSRIIEEIARESGDTKDYLFSLINKGSTYTDKNK